MICFILAGGFAKRMWPLTKDYPKCLLPVGGKPILVDILKKLGPIKAYVSTNEKFAGKISSAISGFDAKLVVEPTRSNEEKLGSIGALIRFVENYSIDDDILLVAADNYFEENLSEFVKCFDGVPLIGVYDIRDVSLAKKYGVVTEKDGFATDFKEKPNNPKSTLIGTGVYILPKDCISTIKSIPINQRDHLGGIIEKLIEEHKIKLFKFKGIWADIGSIKEYLDLTRIVSKELTSNTAK